MTWCNFPMNGNYHEPSVDWLVGKIKQIEDNYNTITDMINDIEIGGGIFINVLNPPDGLEPLKNDGITDNSSNLQAIINYCGTKGGCICFPPGNYIFNFPITIASNGISLLSINPTQCNLICNFSGTLFKYVNVQYCTIKNLTIKSNYRNSIAISIDSGKLIFCEYVYIYNFNTGMLLNNCSNSNFNYLVISTDGTENSAKGIVINGASVSTYFTKIAINLSGSASSVAIQNSGTNVADNIFSNCDIAACSVGILLNGESHSTVNPETDLNILNCVIDGTTESCIHVYKLDDRSSVNIIGGWFNPLNTAGSTAIKIDNSNGVCISDSVFQVVSTVPFNNVIYISANNADIIKIVNNLFYNGYIQISLNSSKHINIANNIGKNEENSASAIFVYSNSTSYLNIVGNNVNGWYGTGIECGSNCEKCIFALNIFDNTHITTPLNISATNSITDNNITT